MNTSNNNESNNKFFTPGTAYRCIKSVKGSFTKGKVYQQSSDPTDCFGYFRNDKGEHQTKFTDPLVCEDYEKHLGKLPGTVGRAKADLSQFNENHYVNGILKVIHDNNLRVWLFSTVCVDDKLENYVNVADLDESKRWISAKLKHVIEALNEFDDTDQCEYEFICCEYRSTLNHTFSMTRSYNQKIWDHKTENKI